MKKGAQISEYQQNMLAYNQHEAAVSRATTSPFDIYNNDQPIGAFLGDFFANLYANGNQPLQMTGSLFGMFGKSFATFASLISPATQAASADAFANSCDDAEINAADMAADPFCHPIYGLPSDDILSADDAVAAMKSDFGADVYDGSKPYGIKASATNSALGFDTIGDFINTCITRNANGIFVPMGSSNEDGSMDAGQKCEISSISDPKTVLYNNAIQYQQANAAINAGSNLGQQVDGTASS